MHELALMEELYRLASEAAQREGASRMERVHLRIGDLSGVDPSALQQAFSVVVSQGSWGEPTLQLERVPTRCFCRSCQSPFAPRDLIYACPLCGLLCAEVLQGRELELVALEVT
ncbi:MULTISPECIES: hydrogenase maturation nickel metallochaperone HypA [unclassified Synechococcus]|jgi:hydrogenase nickel incorporation protein HypA/HybF|uniref:hydrogenase maturation nickel metallochaperone HypA/HybF n=1 Tax=unclassified Synechococcus TaxID=2626047 RepID=UPI0020009156|nr:hydrogenase maturation nickel metallochaperone HypA [Synechococcus sp. A10-1-5-1]UPM50884.1 hydrogenase maturation nickel metallochaperone HypA [Synechococcus sp. A10-1-5-1]